MIFETVDDAINLIKNSLKVSKWVDDARKNHKVLKALRTGENFHEVLIRQIEKIESNDRVTARKKYSKDIRDVPKRIMQPRTNVFTASGGSFHNSIESEQNSKKLISTLANFKGQKSQKKYLSEVFFPLVDTDPNGVLFLEYIKDEDIFPTYKSINDIRSYRSDGQLCEYILFEPVTKIEGNTTFFEWRLVDDKTDWRIKQTGQQFTIIEKLTFEHPFGKVPATILSDKQVMGSELRISPLFPIVELLKDYARDKSVLTIYKFQNGFPKHGKYENFCRSCQGTGKNGTETCTICSGKGIIRVNDVTDTTILNFPREDEPIVAPNLEWFNSPDLETWGVYNEDLDRIEDQAEATIWGQKSVSKGGNETATGRFIDLQPVINALNSFTDNVEFTANAQIDFVVNWINGQPTEEVLVRETYGRRFIIESVDVLLEKYSKSRKEGDNNTILDGLLDQIILATYQSDPILLSEMQKKRLVEPYLHQSIDQVNIIFGATEANKKVIFVDFWEEVDKSKTVQELKSEFKTFTTQNQLSLTNTTIDES